MRNTFEIIVSNYPLTAGSNTVSFTLPAGAINSKSTFARFRLLPTIDEGCYYNYGPMDLLKGSQNNGELEDFAWPFGPTSVRLSSFGVDQTNNNIQPVIWLSVIGLLGLGFLALCLRLRTA